MWVTQINNQLKGLVGEESWPICLLTHHVNTSQGNLLTARPISRWALPAPAPELATGEGVKYAHMEPVSLSTNFWAIRHLLFAMSSKWDMEILHLPWARQSFWDANYIRSQRRGVKREERSHFQRTIPLPSPSIHMLSTQSFCNLLRKQNFKINPSLLSQIRI